MIINKIYMHFTWHNDEFDYYRAKISIMCNTDLPQNQMQGDHLERPVADFQQTGIVSSVDTPNSRLMFFVIKIPRIILPKQMHLFLSYPISQRVCPC